MTGGAGITRADALRLPLADGSVHLSVSSPPYFALRSYQDGGEHYDRQIGSEARPVDFLHALWAVADEVWRVLADDGSAWFNLGDKYANQSRRSTPISAKSTLYGNGHVGGVSKSGQSYKVKRVPREQALRSRNTLDVRTKSLMGLPWRFMMGLICPDLYRAPYEPAACWHDDGPGPCRTCPPRTFPQWVGRAEVVWAKPNGLPESVRDRPRRSHEQWFMVTKQGAYFAGLDEIREPHTMKPQRRTTAHGAVTAGNHDRAVWGNGLRRDEPAPDGHPLGKLPGSVWSIPSAPLKVPDHLGVDHFAAFPPEWPRRLIAGWSPTGICTACGQGRRPVAARSFVLQPDVSPERNGDHGKLDASNRWTSAPRGSNQATITGYACACPDTSAPTRPAVILDPFGGTGTVSMMARAMGRFGVHVDLSRDYNRLAAWRIFESGHGEKALAKAAKRPPRPRKRRVPVPVPPAQAALFDLVGL